MTDGEMLISPSAFQDLGDGAKPADIGVDCTDGEDELSLQEILTLYSQPINEEQAWAVCFQCCRWLTQKQRRKETGVRPPGRIAGPEDVRIRKDGTVKLYQQSGPGNHNICMRSRIKCAVIKTKRQYVALFTTDCHVNLNRHTLMESTRPFRCVSRFHNLLKSL